jgi:hypothetical protein
MFLAGLLLGPPVGASADDDDGGSDDGGGGRNGSGGGGDDDNSGPGGGGNDRDDDREDDRGDDRDGDRNDGENRIRDAVRRGDALPLRDILAIVRQKYKGQVVRIRLTGPRDRLVYRIRMIDTQNRLIEVRVNARSRRILGAGGV